MNIAEEIYKTLVRHCGDEKKVLGTNESTMRKLKAGQANPNTTTLKRLFELNGIKAELVISVKPELGTGKTRIKL